jgi:hypothetical protein
LALLDIGQDIRTQRERFTLWSVKHIQRSFGDWRGSFRCERTTCTPFAWCDSAAETKIFQTRFSRPQGDFAGAAWAAKSSRMAAMVSQNRWRIFLLATLLINKRRLWLVALPPCDSILPFCPKHSNILLLVLVKT